MAKTDCDRCRALQVVDPKATCSKHGNKRGKKEQIKPHGEKSHDREGSPSYRSSSKRKSGDQ